ncbi:hypothetical protein [Amycolatopsis sp. DSM 110486]|uniref:hypothetical protein n=1 Tax=Amycolatopsis sp. DSM 110486 TaxID=2865832 RepID=UPI001C6A1221|nr:hypothetical protein [Amycolatopsis sp. DSM 110486]QYN18454.1 hypothetical protein K1T34_37770 [Amycolatopsis sp. DSM 110486]
MLAADAGDRFEHARALAGIAETLAGEDPETAHRLWQAALSLYEDLNHPAAETIRARMAATVYRR